MALPTANQRVQDFARRKEGHPHLVAVPDRGWEFIPVHPCADETELLQRIQFPPEACTSVDFYWQVGCDVAFVQVYANDAEVTDRAPGLYARVVNNGGWLYNLVAVLTTPLVLTTDLLSVQDRYVALGFSGDAFPNFSLDDRLNFIAGLE